MEKVINESYRKAGTKKAIKNNHLYNEISHPGAITKGLPIRSNSFIKEFYRDLDGDESTTLPDYPNFYNGMREV